MVLSKQSIVGILGVGTMGLGIAQVASRFGHLVLLYDSNHDALKRVKPRLEEIFERQVAKGKLRKLEASQMIDRITICDEMHGFKDAKLIIEAIVEDLEVKRRAFIELESVVGNNSILATNTSSLSVSALCASCKQQDRVIGIHFFNPATAMPLVEIIPGISTATLTVERARSLISDWGKITVLAKDTPGFIVNRVARPFYGEALRIVEERIADVPTVDWAMTEIGGFKMGPFQLMDFIGNDVNLKVTETIYEAFFYDPRYRPSLLQKRLVEARRYGVKASQGFYDYRDGAVNPTPTMDRNLGEQIVLRVLSLLINEAIDAAYLGVASAEDIDLAMTKGVNYPKGLLRWADEIGLERILDSLTTLQAEYGEDRYRPSVLLRQMVRSGQNFYGKAA